MNPEIVKCKCGKASMTYEVIGEDLWSGVQVNTTLKKEGYYVSCTCNDCKEWYDNYDPCMVKIFNI